jgi:hypothetical protein
MHCAEDRWAGPLKQCRKGSEDLDDDMKARPGRRRCGTPCWRSVGEQGFDGTFQDFWEASPQGMRTYPVTRAAMVESDSVRNDRKFRQQRMLPVPLKVDTSGKVFMEPA